MLVKKQIPILDMASSFDHTNHGLYVSQIEPGRKGAALMVEMMVHALQSHDFAGPSVLYAKPGCLNGPIIPIHGTREWYPHSIHASEPGAVAYFKEEHQRRLRRDSASWYGSYGLFAKSRLGQPETVRQILDHAQGGAKRTLEVARRLGWC